MSYRRRKPRRYTDAELFDIAVMAAFAWSVTVFAVLHLVLENI